MLRTVALAVMQRALCPQLASTTSGCHLKLAQRKMKGSRRAVHAGARVERIIILCSRLFLCVALNLRSSIVVERIITRRKGESLAVLFFVFRHSLLFLTGALSMFLSAIGHPHRFWESCGKTHFVQAAAPRLGAQQSGTVSSAARVEFRTPQW